jgi:hypothetical protein
VLKKLVTASNEKKVQREVAKTLSNPTQYTAEEIKKHADKVAAEMKDAEAEKLRLAVKKRFQSEANGNNLAQNFNTDNKRVNSGGGHKKNNKGDIPYNIQAQNFRENRRRDNFGGSNNQSGFRKDGNSNYKRRDPSETRNGIKKGFRSSRGKGGPSQGATKFSGSRNESESFKGRGKPYRRP